MKNIVFVWLLVGSWILVVNADCGNDRSLLNDVYIPKAALFQFMGRHQTKMPSESLCAMYCSSVQLTAFWYDPGTQWCVANWIAKESYTDYIPGSNALKIMVNTRLADSIFNYVLCSVDNVNVLFTVYGAGGYYKIEPNVRGMIHSIPLGNVSYVSPLGGVGRSGVKGVSFSWQTQTLIICGGNQDSHGLSNSSNCYFLSTGFSNPSFPPWTGPISMSQGRSNPNIAPVGDKFYIFGGNVYDTVNDYIDVLDTVTSTMSILKNTDGSPVQFPQLTNIPLSCAIGMNDFNSILIVGGRPGSSGTNAVYSMNVADKTLKQLPNLNIGRFLHACERVVRSNQDYVVVIGGKDENAAYTNTVEFYDLKQTSGSWVLGSMTLPSSVYGFFKGSAISWFDNTGCEAMLLSQATMMMHYCTGNFTWTSSTPPAINAIVAKMDAGPF